MVYHITVMDDDCKEYRKNKRQQKLYSPGSGPLRRSSYGLDEKMDAYGVNNKPRRGEQRNHGSYNTVSDVEVADIQKEQSATNARSRKPEQQLYVPRSGDASSEVERQSRMSVKCDDPSQYRRRMPNKQDKQGYSTSAGSYSRGASRRDFNYKDGPSNDINYNKQYRPTSETRSISPAHSIQDKHVNERNRDSRSMETSGRNTGSCGAKPPTGRRNSAGYSSDSGRSKYMINLDNVPPRFRKKYLEQQAAHHSVEHINRDSRPPMYSALPPYSQNQAVPMSGWSQTLPVRGRGRLKEHPSQTFDRDQFINSYLKNYQVQNSRKSTPSNSYTNLYEPSANDIHHSNVQIPVSDVENQKDYQKEEYDIFLVTKNGTSNVSSDHEASHKHASDNESESISQISSQIIDMTLDWTEEVEKNIKLDDICDTSTSFTQNLTSSSTQDVKSVEPRESKRSGRSKRKDRRSSSRGKKSERNRKDSTVSVQNEPERIRRDSNVSIQHEATNVVSASLRNRDRERRDSHRSNRSSNLGNSRDDLDRWRSLRSYSREQSIEGRIVSQCNSRDASANRAMSPRDHDGFRIPSAAPKSGAWSSNQGMNQKKNGSWASGRTPSVERGRQSPAPPEGGGGGGRRRSKKSRRRGGKPADVPPPAAPPPGATPAPTNLNWREEILESKKHHNDIRQPERSQRTRLNSSMSEKSVSESSNSTAHPGILILPQTNSLKDQSRGGSVETQKLLYDPQNPSKPIVVQTNSMKVDSRIERSAKETSSCGGSGYETGEAARAAKHRALLQEVDRADAILRAHTLRGPLALATHWGDVIDTRKFLQNALQRLLMSDLKYCQADNIEHNFWKILYYNFIETLRKSLPQTLPEDKPKIVKLINVIIQEGNEFFENLVHLLEKTYKFNTEDYINDNHLLPPKGLGYVGLALISVQKLYVFLGDLARYKEQVNDTNNYAKSKFWYTKAQQINPKNGRPYNQLAILAIYARRKLDAVYYYMRSLMSSNPFHSARESLLSLFDENSKKYEAAERKRRAAIETPRNGENGEAASSTQGLRREVWVRPSGHRTTTLRHDTRDEQLASMTPVELNKTFLTSYLHVHGKLITKIGMETFHESASAMLRQFRALLHRQPLPTPAARLLQLTALNMFAVETASAKLKDESTARAAWLQCALGVALLMFGALLERCCALLPEPVSSQHHADALLLLPAIKVWSDWMLCHSSVWNPPPSFDNFEVESGNDPWDWLAKLMNILEELDDKSIQFETEMKEGFVPVRLPEDASLAGFTPLMYMEPAAAWCDAGMPPHAAEHALRARKLLFFGTEYLVGVEPPVLKLEYPAEAPPRYVSAVQSAPAHLAPPNRLCSESSEEPAASHGASRAGEEAGGAAGADAATRRLLRRKEQLESRHATLERRRQHVQEMLSEAGGCVSVEVEVRPRWLVPDTNCFIDHLALLRAVAAAPRQPYLLAVPLVVMTELEGLSRCSRLGGRARASLAWVSGGAPGVRLATSRGSLLASCAFTAEHAAAGTNDDRVLATALNLHANLASEPDMPRDEGSDANCVKRVREVVLLTDDRNLRVKALAAELPARDLPSFIQWAGLDPTTNSPKGVNDSESGHTSK